jgi:hypothetical protein
LKVTVTELSTTMHPSKDPEIKTKSHDLGLIQWHAGIIRVLGGTGRAGEPLYVDPKRHTIRIKVELLQQGVRWSVPAGFESDPVHLAKSTFYCITSGKERLSQAVPDGEFTLPWYHKPSGRADARSLNIAFSRARIMIIIFVEVQRDRPGDRGFASVRGYGRMLDSAEDGQLDIQWLRLHDIPLAALQHLHVKERVIACKKKQDHEGIKCVCKTWRSKLDQLTQCDAAGWSETGKRKPVSMFTGSLQLPQAVGSEICRLIDASVFARDPVGYEHINLANRDMDPRLMQTFQEAATPHDDYSVSLLAQDFRAALDPQTRYKLGRQFGRGYSIQTYSKQGIENKFGCCQNTYAKGSVHQSRPYRRQRLYSRRPAPQREDATASAQQITEKTDRVRVIRNELDCSSLLFPCCVKMHGQNLLICDTGANRIFEVDLHCSVRAIVGRCSR